MPDPVAAEPIIPGWNAPPPLEAPAIPVFENTSCNTTSFIRYGSSNNVVIAQTPQVECIAVGNIDVAYEAQQHHYWASYITTNNVVFGNGAPSDEFSKEAVNRAKALLESVMDEEQRKEAAEKSQFHVRSSKGKVFRIRTTHASGNVEEIDEKGEAVARYCAHPRGVPLGDQLLAQKLALETDEESFLKVANCHWRRDPRVTPELLEQIRDIAYNAQPIYALDAA